jgi:hypothetical protein
MSNTMGYDNYDKNERPFYIFPASLYTPPPAPLYLSAWSSLENIDICGIYSKRLPTFIVFIVYLFFIRYAPGGGFFE